MVATAYTKNRERKLNFVEEIFTRDLISIIFAKFNFLIWGQNCQNKLRISFGPQKFVHSFFLLSTNLASLKLMLISHQKSEYKMAPSQTTARFKKPEIFVKIN